jgi:hypothetical protein
LGGTETDAPTEQNAEFVCSVAQRTATDSKEIDWEDWGEELRTYLYMRSKPKPRVLLFPDPETESC